MIAHQKSEFQYPHQGVAVDVDVDGVTVTALVVLDQSARQSGWLRLVWGSPRAVLSAMQALRPVGRCDPDFGGWGEAARLSRVVASVLELDTVAKAEFLAGRVVVKDIPIRTPSPLPTLPPSATVEDYRRLRVAAGSLVRPALLYRPSEELLMPNQVAGARWLLEHPIGMLADDMGLGKTVQAITALRYLVWRGIAHRCLIVCPSSLLANWEDELSRWAPELARLRVTPRAREREEVWGLVLGRFHVLLASYEHLREPPSALRTGGHVDVVIADEAHRIRNLSAAVTQGIRSLRWARFWALTGTPIERDPRDLATILSTLDPGRFAPSDSASSASTLRARARPYILRRLKNDVLAELPAVLESTETLELLPPQQRAYRRAFKQGMRSGEPGSLLRLVNELRTICDFDPDTGKSAKVERIREILDTVAIAQEKAVVFSYLLRPLYILEAELTKSGIGSVRLEGSLSLAERDAVLRRFRLDASITALLASTRVGGEGLTLTAANHVLFLNEWWNPSGNAQARDRVIRIGQQRGVSVYRFRCRGTIEEVLERILQEKSESFFQIVDRLADPLSQNDPDVVKALGELKTRLANVRGI
jgi:SNF2 family DNA or RNA helicase